MKCHSELTPSQRVTQRSNTSIPADLHCGQHCNHNFVKGYFCAFQTGRPCKTSCCNAKTTLAVIKNATDAHQAGRPLRCRATRYEAPPGQTALVIVKTPRRLPAATAMANYVLNLRQRSRCLDAARSVNVADFRRPRCSALLAAWESRP